MRNIIRNGLLLLGLTTLHACGGASDAGSDAPPASSGLAPSSAVPDAESLGSKAISSTEFGALHGEIRVVGKLPDRFPIGARKLKDCCSFPDVEHLSDIIVSKAGKLQYTFVTLESGFDKAFIPKPTSEAVFMDQRGCIYTPHVLAMQTGQKLLVKNSDPLTHNVNFSAPKNGGGKNRGMVAGQEPLEFELKREDAVQLKCDIHPWMSASVHVARHPWFAVSGEDGTFSIPDVPPGEYVVRAEHAELGTVRGRLVVEAGKSTGFALTLRAD